MVKDTRKASGIGDIRPINQPVTLAVTADDTGLPATLKLRGRWFRVEHIDDRWRIDDEWWRDQPVSRMYFECTVDTGIKVTVYQDLIAGQWYCQRV